VELFSLSFGAALGAATVPALRTLREHRAEPAGVADLLAWAFLVDDGVLLQKDGSLLAGWRYQGPDINAATPAELESLSAHVNEALLPLADGWMLHADAVRRPATSYTPSVFPDAVSQLIENERCTAHASRAKQLFETECVLTITYLPPGDSARRLSRLFLQRSDHAAGWHRILEDFATARRAFEARLDRVLTLERLDSDALLTHLHRCLTGLTHVVRMPPHGSYIDHLLADQELVGGFEPRMGDRAIRCVALQGYPGRAEPAHLDRLGALPAAFRWSTRVIPLGHAEAARLIRRHQLLWFKKRKGAAAWAQEMAGASRKSAGPNADDELFLDHDARAMAHDAAVALAASTSGAVRYAFATQVVVVMDCDASHATATAEQALEAAGDAGCTGRIETVNALEAFLGSLPGHGYANLRRPLLHTRNLADLLPVTSVWPGLPRNPSPLFPPESPPLLWAATAGSTPFRLNLHDSDVGHTLVLGKTGSGKSVLLGLIAAQFRRYPRSHVFAFDVGYSMWLLTHAMGGRHYDLAGGHVDALRFQPLAQIDEPAERAWAAGWLETVLGLQGVAMTPPLRARLDAALALVARTDRAHRTLTELAVHLQHDTLTAALRPYTVAGPYGQLLDAGSDDLAEGDLQVFELRHLFDLDDRIALPVLLYLFRRLEQRLDGRPALFIIDEAWLALAHSLFGARINQWLLQLRKANAAVILATQSPAQLASLPHRHTIVDSCVTRIFLPNADAMAPGSASLYRDLGLNDRELRTVADATPKRHYYYRGPRGSRLFELGLGPVARAFLTPPNGQTIDETKREVERLIESAGDDWPAQWLAQRGLGEWAERWRSRRDAVYGASAPHPMDDPLSWRLDGYAH